jgi:uncharacterized membrane protein YciS (DUF1049 family)
MINGVAALGKLLWAVAAVVLFAFALLAVNQGHIALRFLDWQTPEVSVFWWLLAAFMLGVLCASLGYGIAAVRSRLRERSLNRQLEESRRELETYRSARS